MSEQLNEMLKIENQICFPLYACSREVIKLYKPYLDELDLTYTQYVTMMVLWEEKAVNVKELGKRLYLDSGTLTPLLKKLEAKGLVSRTRSTEDERNLIISVTPRGEQMKEEALDIPGQMAKEVKLAPGEAELLYKLLYKMLQPAEE